MNYYAHTCKCGCGGQIKIRESHKYDGIPLYITGHSSKGKYPTEETRKKQSEAHKGEKHYNWQNGVSKLPYAFDFTDELKQSVKERDFHICQEPNCMEVNDLVTHHIDYNKQNSSIDNLISLCRKHHSKTNGKNNREYWTNYYQEILNVYL